MSWDTTLQIDKLKRRSRHDQIRHGTHFSEIANAIDGKYCCSHENLSTMSTFTSHAPYHDKCQYGSSNPGFLGNELPRQALKHDSVICGYSTTLEHLPLPIECWIPPSCALASNVIPTLSGGFYPAESPALASASMLIRPCETRVYADRLWAWRPCLTGINMMRCVPADGNNFLQYAIVLAESGVV
jgi:hypothetical protein